MGAWGQGNKSDLSEFGFPLASFQHCANRSKTRVSTRFLRACDLFILCIDPKSIRVGLRVRVAMRINVQIVPFRV